MGPAYRSLPQNSPANRVASAELLNAYHGHVEWMQRWRLPSDDTGWCVVTIYWRSVEFGGRNQRGDDAPAPPAIPNHVPASNLAHDGLPDLALFHPNHFKQRADLLHTVEQPTAEELASAIGRWAQDLAETMLRTSASVTLPSLTWNPWLESRAAAETRLVEAAEPSKSDLTQPRPGLMRQGRRRPGANRAVLTTSAGSFATRLRGNRRRRSRPGFPRRRRMQFAWRLTGRPSSSGFHCAHKASPVSSRSPQSDHLTRTNSELSRHGARVRFIATPCTASPLGARPDLLPEMHTEGDQWTPIT